MTLTPERVAELRSRFGGERRFYVPSLEARAEAGSDGAWTLVGHAAVFDRKSDPIPDGWGGTFREIVKRGAFKDALDENQDVVVLWNHDMRWLLGRTGNKTFTVRESPRGLEYRGTPAPTSYAADLRVLLQRGDISQSSFGFTVAEDRWIETKKDDGTVDVTREIVKIKRLYDVSPVTIPAYPQTDAGARSDMNAEQLAERVSHSVAEAIVNALNDETRASTPETPETPAIEPAPPTDPPVEDKVPDAELPTSDSPSLDEPAAAGGEADASTDTTDTTDGQARDGGPTVAEWRVKLARLEHGL